MQLKRWSAGALIVSLLVACVAIPVPKAKATEPGLSTVSVEQLGGAFSSLARTFQLMQQASAERDELMKADIISRQQLTEAFQEQAEAFKKLAIAMERKP